MAKGVKGFQKGNEGRKPGSENKINKDVREAFKNLIENNIDNMTIWLSDIADNDPHKAMSLLLAMAEYHIPKLARTELKHEGEQTLTVKFIEDGTEDSKS